MRLLIRSSVNFTSSAVNAVPSCQVTPWRSLMRQFQPVLRDAAVADGGNLSGQLWNEIATGIDVPKRAEYVPVNALIDLDMWHQRIEHRRFLRQADNDLAGWFARGGRRALRGGNARLRCPGCAGKPKRECLAAGQASLAARRPDPVVHVSPRAFPWVRLAFSWMRASRSWE